LTAAEDQTAGNQILSATKTSSIYTLQLFVLLAVDIDYNHNIEPYTGSTFRACSFIYTGLASFFK
jgi:hypothetical protein